MDEEKIEIPDFMRDYYDGSDEEGKAILDNLAASYQRTQQESKMIIAYQQAIHNRLWGRLAKKVNPEVALNPIRQDYSKRAEMIARDFGYTGKSYEPMDKNDVISRRQEFLNELKANRQKSVTLNRETTPERKTTDNQEGNLTSRDLFKQNLASIREKKAIHVPRV